MSKNITVILFILLGDILIWLGGFFAGRATTPKQTKKEDTNNE